MSRACFYAIGLIAVITQLRADWKITTATETKGEEFVATEYYKGKLHRTDVEHNGKAVQVVIVDGERLQQTVWDSGAKQYTVFGFPRPSKPSALVRPNEEPPTILRVNTNTRDTGERRVFFGRTARHLIADEKRTWEDSGAAGPASESETLTDGWYIDDASLPNARTRLVAYTLAAGARPTLVIKESHSGPVLVGLLVRAKVTTRSFSANGPTQEAESTLEVKELSDAPLPTALFEPPAGFKRVARLPTPTFRHQQSFSDEIEFYWDLVEGWFLSLFS